jgi:PAS domain-containing protein
LDQQECPERIELTEEYSRAITDFVVLRNGLRRVTLERDATVWHDAETAWAESEKAWIKLERHIAAHKCLPGLPRDPDRSSRILEQAAEAAPDIILVVDDERRFVAVNDSAAGALGLPRRDIVGRRLEEFFSQARGETIAQAWDSFVLEGVQSGICELSGPGRGRRFEYRALARFAPGLHMSILREIGLREIGLRETGEIN